MTTELTYLTLTALLTASLWIPYIVGLVKTRGVLKPADYKVAPDSPVPHWVTRANRAHINAVESFGPFVAVVLTAHVAGISTGVTTIAVMVYFWSRVAHAVVHITGFSMGMARTMIFTVGYAAVVTIGVELLRHCVV